MFQKLEKNPTSRNAVQTIFSHHEISSKDCHVRVLQDAGCNFSWNQKIQRSVLHILVFQLEFEPPAKNARKETTNMFNANYSTETGNFNVIIINKSPL